MDEGSRGLGERLRDVARAARAFARGERAVLIALTVVASALAVFGAIAGKVVKGDTHAFDEAVLLAMRNPSNLAEPYGPPWFQQVVRDFSGLGGGGVIALVTIASVGFLLLTRHRRNAVLILVAVVGGVAGSLLLKLGFDRPRPEVTPLAAQVYGSSFPSGHSMVSAAAYLTLGALLARLGLGRGPAIYVVGVAVTVVLLVGTSRVYLGVHWPTDVLAGWALGSAWALLCWVAATWLERRTAAGGTADGPD